MEHVRSLVLGDKGITSEAIQATLGISPWAVTNILHEELGLYKLCSRWVPHLSTEVQKKACVDWCKSMLFKFDMGISNRVVQIISGEKTWLQ